MPKLSFILRLSHLVLIGVLVLSACGSDEDSPTPAPQNTSAPPVEQPTSAPEEPTAPVEETSPTPNVGNRGIGASGEGSFDTSGTYVADLGFRPDYDGFSFPNYGSEATAVDLTADDIRRMFGDQVCATMAGDTCVLTPAGKQWMESLNQSMGGGHCEGMAVLSNLLYTKRLTPTNYGADTTPELSIAGNADLQREIAYWFTTQATLPAREGIVQQTPKGILNTLFTAFEAGPSGSNTYAVGFYKRDMTGGHAVTPYAIEDRGGGIYWIMIYDNNYPGAARAIEIDTNADTWRYSGSTNPSEPADDYEGDAESFTLELAAIEPRLGQQACPFCAESGSASAPGGKNTLISYPAADTMKFNQVWLEGAGDLLITDLDGQSIGFREGKFVNEIPGARSNANKFGVDVWNTNAEPVYYLPVNVDFTIEINGDRLTEPSTTTVTFIGPGYVLEVSDIYLEPGQVDTLDIAPDGSFLSYRTETAETPVMLVGIETTAADYLFAVQGYELGPDQALNLSLDTKEGWLSLDSIDNTVSASYSLYMVKYDDTSEQIFGTDDVSLDPDDVIYVDYLKWPGNEQPMELDVDRGGDGTVDETLELPDVTDVLEEGQ